MVVGLQRWGRQHWPGLVLCQVVALAALSLSAHYQAPAFLLALLLGMALNALSRETACSPGIEFTARQVLRIGVALLGLRITLDQVLLLGWQPLLMVALAVGTTLVLGVWLSRRMGQEDHTGWISGAAVAVCGASAAMAVAAALPSHPRKETAALRIVVGVSILSTGAMLAYPMLVTALGLQGQAAGIFLGGTIHDVAQVIGAGYALSPQAGDTATVVKLARVAMLAPVVLLVALVHRRAGSMPSQERPPVLPAFLIGFCAAVLLGSSGWLPPALVQAGRDVSQLCLVSAMAAIGMKTHLPDVLGSGWKPMLLMVVLTLFLATFCAAWLSGLA